MQWSCAAPELLAFEGSGRPMHGKSDTHSRLACLGALLGSIKRSKTTLKVDLRVER